jgi:ABC-type hemin transport system substrate-binding protein
VAWSCRHSRGSCSLCILRQCRYRRVHIVIPISHLHMSLPALLKSVAPIGLCWNRHSDAWGVRIGHLRWVLLRSSAAEVVLVYGKYNCVPIDPRQRACPSPRAHLALLYALTSCRSSPSASYLLSSSSTHTSKAANGATSASSSSSRLASLASHLSSTVVWSMALIEHGSRQVCHTISSKAPSSFSARPSTHSASLSQSSLASSTCGAALTISFMSS